MQVHPLPWPLPRSAVEGDSLLWMEAHSPPDVALLPRS
jgi:hypothetical protein